MLKKILLLLILLTGTMAHANYLNSVVISNNEGHSSIILRSDEVVKVKKEVTDANKVILTLKGISKSTDINTLYKNTSKVNGLVIQNEGNNDLKIYIDAPDISKADIVFETPDSAPVVLDNTVKNNRIIWTIISLLSLIFIMHRSKKEKPLPSKSELIKEREKALYKNFQKEIASMPSMNYKLKSYRKHVLKGETIRSYESRMALLNKN